MALVYVLKKASNTKSNNILRYKRNEMSTGIGGKCHFVCFLFVLCIIPIFKSSSCS